jgi:hypothetical protein
MSEVQIETLELSIEQAQKSVKLMNQMDKLRKNKEFKAIIEDELLDNYARNTVYLLSDPNMSGEAEQADLIKDLEMVGRVRQFFSTIYQKGRMAEKTIIDSNVTIDELREEGVDE